MSKARALTEAERSDWERAERLDRRTRRIVQDWGYLVTEDEVPYLQPDPRTGRPALVAQLRDRDGNLILGAGDDPHVSRDGRRMTPRLPKGRASAPDRALFAAIQVMHLASAMRAHRNVGATDDAIVCARQVIEFDAAMTLQVDAAAGARRRSHNKRIASAASRKRWAGNAIDPAQVRKQYEELRSHRPEERHSVKLTKAEGITLSQRFGVSPRRIRAILFGP